MVAGLLLGLVPSLSAAQGQRDEQVAPVPAARPISPSPKRVELSALGGAVFRPSRGTSPDYRLGPSLGGAARVGILSWLGARAQVRKSWHRVDARAGDMGLAGTTLEQPDLRLLDFSLHAEPTYALSPRLALWGSIGVGWGRVSAPAPSSRGELRLRSEQRDGVTLDVPLAIGVSVIVVPRWVVLRGELGGAWLPVQTGALFEDIQAFDQEGHLHHLDGLPRFRGELSTGLSLGILL